MFCNTRIISLVTILFFGAIASGCASYTPISQASIGTSGVTIKAEDGSFVLKSGKRFKTPFSYKKSISQSLDSQRPMVESWNRVLKKKAGKKVRVKVKGEKKELYGVLAFGSVKKIRSCSGPAIRSHLISIPEQYIDAAKGGNVSVIFETYTCRGVKRANYNWMLWLSDSPFLS